MEGRSHDCTRRTRWVSSVPEATAVPGAQKKPTILSRSALAIRDLLQHHLFRVGLGCVKGNAQRIGPELEGQDLGHRRWFRPGRCRERALSQLLLSAPGSDFAFVVLEDGVQDRVLALQAVWRKETRKLGFLGGCHLLSQGVHVKLSLGELHHQTVLGERRLVVLDQFLHSKVRLLEALHVKLLGPLCSHGGGEDVALPRLLQFWSPKRKGSHLDGFECHTAASELCVQGLVGGRSLFLSCLCCQQRFV